MVSIELTEEEDISLKNRPNSNTENISEEEHFLTSTLSTILYKIKIELLLNNLLKKVNPILIEIPTPPPNR